MNQALDEMRMAVRSGDVAYSLHAIEEMSEEGVSFEEIHGAVLGPDAKVIESRTDDPRGERHLVYGQTLEARPLRVVFGVAYRPVSDFQTRRRL